MSVQVRDLPAREELLREGPECPGGLQVICEPEVCPVGQKGQRYLEGY